MDDPENEPKQLRNPTLNTAPKHCIQKEYIYFFYLWTDCCLFELLGLFLQGFYPDASLHLERERDKKKKVRIVLFVLKLKVRK